LPPGVEPSQEAIDKVHAQMCAGVQALFDKHKASYGWEHKKLIIK
jgi:hypothetical protein